MELTDLAHRLSVLERQLAAARWRERAVYASAILIGLVFACKSSTATDDKPPPEQPKRLVIGGVTIDERGITIVGLGTAITIEDKAAGADRSTRIAAGDVRLGKQEGDAALIRLEAHGSQARIEAKTPAYRTTMSTTAENAEINVFKLGDAVHGAEMRLTGSDARIHASVKTHSASLVAAGDDKARAEVTARVVDKSVGLTTVGGKPELVYAK
jgi:hypothetical protein